MGGDRGRGRGAGGGLEGGMRASVGLRRAGRHSPRAGTLCRTLAALIPPLLCFFQIISSYFLKMFLGKVQAIGLVKKFIQVFL